VEGDAHNGRQLVWLSKIQAASGLIFALFLGLHLATTASAIGGGGTYDSVLTALRDVYRPSLVVEILLIAIPALTHIVCAVLKILYRRRHPPSARAPWHIRIHRWAGYVLLAVIFGHVFATRVMPALAQGATATGKADFAYLAFSVLNWPVFIDPYYFLLGCAGALHLSLGLGVGVQVLLPKRLSATKVRAASVFAAALILTLVWVGVASMIAASGTAPRTRFREYAAVYKRFMPFMKPTMDLPDPH
jgi:succinate dehydrogenase/fumarate reductase cytochrome b subunit